MLHMKRSILDLHNDDFIYLVECFKASITKLFQGLHTKLAMLDNIHHHIFHVFDKALQKKTDDRFITFLTKSEQ